MHCSGLNRTDNTAHLHTNFKLSSEGEQVMLSNASGQPMDLVSFDLLKTDTAYRARRGRQLVGGYAHRAEDRRAVVRIVT